MKLTATARGGLARAVLTQRFRNPYADPLQVTYLFPLPHDGAVSGFAFVLDGRRTVGEVDRTAAARERFEEALLLGRSAALVEELRGSLFTQEVGNIPPGAELEMELTVDQRLSWLSEGAWEWHFPTAVAPRYQGAKGRSPNEARAQVEVVEAPLPVSLTLALEVRDTLPGGGLISSPSHQVRVGHADGGHLVSLAAERGAALDRDVVVRWTVASPEVGVALEVQNALPNSRLAGRTFGLLTIVPPIAGTATPIPRDLIILLDTSGSMAGAPLDQARRVVEELVRSLSAEDRLEIIGFSSTPRRWCSEAVAATEANKRAALEWLAILSAGGGTEMTSAMLEALTPLRRDAQRQVVLVTDGEIGFEHEVVRALIEELPAGSRLHTVGVGSAVNRSLTAPTARAGRGVEVLIGLDESPAEAARRLLAHTVAPVVTELSISGDALVAAAPMRLPDLFAGAPVLLALELSKAGGTLTVQGRTADGAFARTVAVPAGVNVEQSAALCALFARESIEDLELRSAAGEDIDKEIERIGLDFQISTRLTSWVAVTAEKTVDPTRPTRRERVPQQLPYGMSVEELGLRSGVAAAFPRYRFQEPRLSRAEFALPPMPPPRAAATPPPLKRVQRFGRSLRSIPATVAGVRGDRLWLTAEVVDDPINWAPGATVIVVLDDGTELTLAVEASATTAKGRLAPGTVLRLVLALTAPPPGPKPVRVVVSHDLELELSP